MNASTTALILIEYQNEFVSEGGKLHDGVAPCMSNNNMLTHSIETVKAARDKGSLILHVPITFSSDHREISGEYGILQAVKSSEAFIRGEWGGAIVDAMTPADSDIVVEGKKGLCAFTSTNLDFILRQRGIKTVALAGFLTNCCVESTMRSAYELGYEVVTLTDCCAATSIEAHEAAIKFTFPMFSKPLAATDFIKTLV